jgi:hypothetical protein
MAQLFPPRANAIARVVLATLLVVPACAILFGGMLQRTRYATDVGLTVQQPVPFSHRHHVGGLGLDCRYCHTGVEKADFAGLPPTHTCMTCHSQLWTQAEMLAPVRKSLADDRPLRWNRVTKLPDYVYFNHSVHIKNGVGCTTCHGAIDTMPLTQKAEPMTMGWCLDCHRNPEPNLRPPEAVFSTAWKPVEGEVQGHALMKFYGIDVDKLTDCSTCHR